MLSSHKNTSQIASLVLPAILGLVAGMGYGVFSHHVGFPVSLSEQFLPSIGLN